MTMIMAMAAAATAAALEIFLGWQMAQFQGLIDVFLDGFLDLVHFFLGVDEGAGDRVIEQGFAMGLEVGNFLAGKRLGVLLFLLEGLAFGHEAFVLLAAFIIVHEGVDVFAGGTEILLIQDGLAEFPGFLADERFFDSAVHKLKRVV